MVRGSIAQTAIARAEQVLARPTNAAKLAITTTQQNGVIANGSR